MPLLRFPAFCTRCDEVFDSHISYADSMAELEEHIKVEHEGD